MSEKNLNKMICFGNERKKMIVEKMIADEAAIEHLSTSRLIEQHLLDSLLPKHKTAAAWIQSLYEGKTDISGVLYSCFAYLSGYSIRWQPKYDNAYEIVQFANRLTSYKNDCPEKGATEIHHFLTQLSCVAAILEDTAKEIEETESLKSYEVQKEAKLAREIYESAEEAPAAIMFSDIYTIVLDNWEYLRDSTRTYRLLADVALMQKNFTNTEETRYELVQLLKRVTAQWDE